MLLLVAKRQVGVIGGHKIFAVEDSTVIALGNVPKDEHEKTRSDEQRYKRLFFGIDLTSFYFSYTYNLTRTLQHNMVMQEQSSECDEKFTWNWYLSEAVRDQLSPKWFVPVIQGYVASVTYGAHFDQAVRFTLISRRSAFYAGTRYLKRGISENGCVANDVETEQIIQELTGHSHSQRCHMSSYVQIRGSIPLFWAQENTFAVPKPDIVVYRSDPFLDAAIQHMQDLFGRYGAPVVLLNLIKHQEKKPREIVLGERFKAAVETINASLPRDKQLKYISFDYAATKKKEQVAVSLVPIARDVLNRTGFFHTGLLNGAPLQREEMEYPIPSAKGMLRDWFGMNPLHQRGRLQEGVLRSNCIDSLDRTNATQFCVGVAAVGQQLFAMGLTGEPTIEYTHPLITLVLTLYEEMGDAIAVQYAGSLLAHRMNNSSSKWSSVSKDVMTSIRRFYTSTFTDTEKQCSINLFLGRFRPYQDQKKSEPLWALATDAMLHNTLIPHRRPLWCTEWWKAPLARYEALKQTALARLPAPNRSDLDLALLVRRRGSRQPIEYSSKVSTAFVRAFHPGRLSYFDEILAKPYLHIHRPLEEQQQVASSVSSGNLLAVTESKQQKAQTAAEYATYLSGLSKWVQSSRRDRASAAATAMTTTTAIGGESDVGDARHRSNKGTGSRIVHPVPLNGGGGGGGAVHSSPSSPSPPLPSPPPPPPPPQAPSSPGPDISVGPGRVEKYHEYVDFSQVHVWESRDAERSRMSTYLNKCMSTTLVELSPDFLPSNAFYSVYLLESETFSFEATSSASRFARDHIDSWMGKELDVVPISDVEPRDYAALFLEGTIIKSTGRSLGYH